MVKPSFALCLKLKPKTQKLFPHLNLWGGNMKGNEVI